MTDQDDVIAAFVDSEPVGAQDLAAALSAKEGRDYFIDLLVLRGLVGDGVTGLQPGGRGGRAARVLQGAAYVAGGLQPAGHSKPRRLWLTAAAALITAGLAGGFLAGRMTTGRTSSMNLQVSSDVAPAGATTTAPAPTHVIRMEKGVDWNERSGGN